MWLFLGSFLLRLFSYTLFVVYQLSTVSVWNSLEMAPPVDGRLYVGRDKPVIRMCVGFIVLVKEWYRVVLTVASTQHCRDLAVVDKTASSAAPKKAHWCGVEWGGKMRRGEKSPLPLAITSTMQFPHHYVKSPRILLVRAVLVKAFRRRQFHPHLLGLPYPYSSETEVNSVVKN